MKRKQISAALLVFVMGGCASISTTDDAVKTRAASALGVSASDVEISDRRNSGVRTDFVAKANGKVYNCYVTGAVSITGRTVSDAICNAQGEKARNPLTGK
jgi:hypothetical protein